LAGGRGVEPRFTESESNPGCSAFLNDFNKSLKLSEKFVNAISALARLAGFRSGKIVGKITKVIKVALIITSSFI
jgi:hypothetical protein